jgi:quinol monooxygenase YgiN
VEEYDTGFVPEEIWAQKTDTASYESRIGMFTFTLLFKFKPGTDVAEIQRLFSETMMQALPAVPGLISFKVYKYEGLSQNATVAWQETTEWEWVFVETWDSKESHDKASMGKVLGPDGSVARSGFYEKFNSAIEKSFGFYATATN